MKHSILCLFWACSFLYGQTSNNRAIFLTHVARTQNDELVDMRTYPGLEHIVHLCKDADAEVYPALGAIADYIKKDIYIVPVDLLRSVLLELQQLQLTRTHQTEILSLQLAAVGLGLNFESSTQPFVTQVAQQQSLQTGATQIIEIGSAHPAGTLITPSPVKSGFEINVGTGYGTLADQSPQTINIGSPGTTTNFLGTVNIPAPTNVSALTSTTFATVTTRNTSANPAIFTFDNTDQTGATSPSGTLASTGNLTLTAATNVVVDAPAAVQIGANTATSLSIGNTGALTTITNATLSAQNGTTAAPSINFLASPTTGLSSPLANTLSMSTSAAERLRVSSTGTVSINQFNTAGVVHNNALGELFSALVSTADTTATSTNTAGRIVARDGSGNFAAGTITATLNGNATSANSATSFTGSLAGDVTGTQANTAVAFVGGQSATNVATATALANAATNLNTPNAIVRRDGTGSFNAGSVTAQTSLLSNTIDALAATTLSIGAAHATALTITPQTTLQSTLTLPVGAVGSPTLRFGTSTSTGLYAPVADTFSLTAVGSEKLRISSAGLTVPAFTIAGVVHNSAAGLLSSSLIVNADITTGTIANDRLATIATADTSGAIVVRDGTGNFATRMITIDGTPTVSTDVATVGYVTSAVAGGFKVLAPALYASTSSSEVSNPPSGTPIIDGFAVATGNRVLLTAQSDPIYNGLWVVTTAAWTRPADFTNGTQAGNSYVLITSGINNVNTSWVCTTPTATIGTNPLFFTLFSLGSTTTGANLGVSPTTGQVYKNKTGSVLNFRSIAPGDSHVTVQNNLMTGNTVDIATDATNNNMASTIVARDGSGNFSAGTITASLAGAASLNVLKAGDSMTGPLLLSNQQPVRFGDTTAHYIGLQAPATVGTNYTVTLPAAAPTTGQYLQAASATALQWATVGGIPTATKVYYVALNGSDANDGSIAAPYRTVSYAVQQANGAATFANPVVINVGAGVFVENNSAGPLRVTASGVSIVGQSYTGTVIQPSTPANALFEITNALLASSQLVIMQNMTVDATGLGSTNAGISVVDTQTILPYYSSAVRLDSMLVRSFQTGISTTSNTGILALIYENLTFRGNGTAISTQNTSAIIKNSIIFGPLLGSSVTPVNTGIVVGASPTAAVNIIGTLFSKLSTGLSASSATARLVACEIEETVNGVVAATGASLSLTGVNFAANPAAAVNVYATGTGTNVTLDGCHFNCADTSVTPTGIALKAQQNGSITVVASSINRAALGILCGIAGDTATTAVKADSLVLLGCTKDIEQYGTSTMRFLGGVFENNLVTINDPTNVTFSAYDRTADDALMIGTGSNIDQTVYQIFNALSAPFPNLSYKPVWYGTPGTVYTDSGAAGTSVRSVAGDAATYAVVQDRTKKAGISLRSDTVNLGATDNVINWSITKLGTTPTQPDLTFDFSNNDITPAIDAYTCMRLNGFVNQLEFPLVTTVNQPTYTSARLSWAGDTLTNLYRAATNTLQTDGSFISGQNISTVNGSLTAGNTLVSPLSSNLNFVKLRGGGAIVSGDSLGSITFQGNDGTGNIVGSQIKSVNSGTVAANRIASNLEFYTHPDSTTASTQRMVINSAGNVVINTPDSGTAFSVTSGGASISGNTNINTTGAGTTLIGNGTVTATLNGNVLINNDNAGSITNIGTGTTTGAVTVGGTGTQTINLGNGAGVKTVNLGSTNTTSTTTVQSGTGVNLISSLRIADATGVTLTANTATTSGITANVGSNGGFNIVGGPLIVPAGNAAAPSLKFAGSTNTGFSAATANTLSFDTNGTQRMSISTANIITQLPRADQAIQAVTAANNGAVTVNAGVSVLVLSHAANVTNFSITFPANPINGQLFTILDTTTNSIALNNIAGAGGATIVAAITVLHSDANMSATQNGASVTYMYLSASNVWCKYARG